MSALGDIMIGDNVVIEYSQMQKMENGQIKVIDVNAKFYQFPIADFIVKSEGNGISSEAVFWIARFFC